jgi:RNA polymerase sigma-70 factor (ECF subfamily)
MDTLRAVASVLFERHHLAVYRYFLRMTGQRELAEDLTQELFLRVVRGLAGCQDTGRELPWLFRIARNLLIDYQRQAGRQVMVPLNEAEALTVTAPAVLSVDLAEAFAQLTHADREVFLLRETGGDQL